MWLWGYGAGGGGLTERLLEERLELGGNVRPLGDGRRQVFVARGVVDDLAVAHLGDARLVVGNDLARELGAAALDQDVGHRRAEGRPIGDRRQVIMALGL